MIDAANLQAFSDKHCRGKVARLDLLLDMCAALGVRLTAQAETNWHDPDCPFETHCYCDDSAPHDSL